MPDTSARLTCAAAAFALAACAPPPEVGGAARESRGDAPPALVPTALFDAPLARAPAEGAALAAGADDLAARAAALRARAAALSADPALDPDARARLEAARPR